VSVPAYNWLTLVVKLHQPGLRGTNEVDYLHISAKSKKEFLDRDL
jgi:hypothetical protein